MEGREEPWEQDERGVVTGRRHRSAIRGRRRGCKGLVLVVTQREGEEEEDECRQLTTRDLAASRGGEEVGHGFAFGFT